MASTSLSLQQLNIGIAFRFVSHISMKVNRQILAHGADLELSERWLNLLNSPINEFRYHYGQERELHDEHK